MDFPMLNPRRARAGQAAPPKAGLGVVKASERVKAARAGITRRAGQMRMAWRFVLVAILVSLASIVWLSQTSTIVSYGYEIEKLEKQKVTLNRQSEQLQSQVAQYENLKRVEEEARAKLGMIPSKNSVYVKVPTSHDQSTGPVVGKSNLAPVNDWWRELTEMLPRPFRVNDQTR